MSEPYWEPLAAVAASTISVGTSLPGSPADGNEYILVDSLTTPTYAWRFRYVSGITDSYKWIFVGGSKISSRISTSESTTSSSYVNTSTIHSVTCPRGGLYLIEFSVITAGLTAGNGYHIAPKIGAAATADADGVNPVGYNAQFGVGSSIVKTCAASDVIALQIRSDGGTSVTWKDRFLSIIPVRVA